MDPETLHALKEFGVPPLAAFVVWRLYAILDGLKKGQEVITGMVVRIALKQGWVKPEDLPRDLRLRL